MALSDTLENNFHNDSLFCLFLLKTRKSLKFAGFVEKMGLELLSEPIKYQCFALALNHLVTDQVTE